MPKMDGFEFASKILEQDVNVRVFFVTAKEINIQALKEQRPSLSVGFFIKKPVTIENLVSKVKTELDLLTNCSSVYKQGFILHRSVELLLS
jgi:response regulator RpfG family c-di-GMP phosphodiesterase